jgi:hypothetical protein
MEIARPGFLGRKPRKGLSLRSTPIAKQLYRRDPGFWRSPGGPENSSFYELHVERDGDFIADQKTAALERCIPGQAEVFAADLCGR